MDLHRDSDSRDSARRAGWIRLATHSAPRLSPELLGSDTNFAAAHGAAPCGRAEGSANLGSDPKNSCAKRITNLILKGALAFKIRKPPMPVQRALRWVAQRGLGVLPNKGGARRAEDIRGAIHCGALGPHTSENRTYAFRNDLSR